MSFRAESGPAPRSKQLGFPSSFNPIFMPPGFPTIPSMPDNAPPPQPMESPRGSATTVFIGNIDEKCTNEFLERMMQECGRVLSWKRIQGSNGKPQAFGFCEFEEPGGTLRALRLLSSLAVNGKKLVVKAEDAVLEALKKWQLNEAKSDGKVVGEDSEGKVADEEEERKGAEEFRKKIISWAKVDFPDISVSAAEKIEENETEESKKHEKGKKHHHHHHSRHSEREHRHRSRRRRSSSRASSKSRRGSSEEKHRKRKRVRSSSVSEDELEARRELKRFIREKERSYRKRVEAWEEREEQRAKIYEKAKKQKKEEKSQAKHEADKLRHFLERYKDDQDEKWYMGEALKDRLKLREKEMMEDAMDRLLEEKEIEETAAKTLMTMDIVVDGEDSDNDAMEEDAAAGIETSVVEPERWTVADAVEDGRVEEKSVIVEKTVVMSTAPSLPQKNKLSDVFGMEDDEEVDLLRQRKTLVKFEITAEDRREHMTDHERKEITRNIVKGIPTAKAILFSHPLDWEQVDEDFIDRKIKPWVAKKIKGSIGEEDDSLRDFICEKIVARVPPAEILQDIKMILDEDADTLVIKLWRLLHFEVEAKRMGVSK